MKDYKTIVEKVLKEHPETRDDDHKLFVWICHLECPKLCSEEFSKVFWNHATNGLPSYDTITRARQSLQHDKPELRGKLYEKRHSKQSDYLKAFGRKYT